MRAKGKKGPPVERIENFFKKRGKEPSERKSEGRHERRPVWKEEGSTSGDGTETMIFFFIF